MSVAGVAHPVERHLAKVEVASSSLVTRSIRPFPLGNGLFLFSPSGSNHSMQYASGMLLVAGLDGGHTTISLPLREVKCKRASSPAPSDRFLWETVFFFLSTVVEGLDPP